MDVGDIDIIPPVEMRMDRLKVKEKCSKDAEDVLKVYFDCVV